MLQHDKPDDFVIATGETNTVRGCVEIAFDQAGLRLGAATSSIDDAFKRPAEVDLLVGDAVEGRARARLEAADELRAADPADGRRRPRAAGSDRLAHEIGIVGLGTSGCRWRSRSPRPAAT